MTKTDRGDLTGKPGTDKLFFIALYSCSLPLPLSKTGKKKKNQTHRLTGMEKKVSDEKDKPSWTILMHLSQTKMLPVMVISY